ncbi:MAG: branched-chain amino acid ABC transporter permease [Pseudomonadota bacterium]|nr:branched-chain amino acid ABC transporter permease [Pseudomonadota bacterium]
MDYLNALTILANYIIIPGLAYGSQLALGALGVTMIYAVLRFSNFAHGELMSFGAMSTILCTWALQSMGITLTLIPTAILAIPIGAGITVLYCLFVNHVVYEYYREKKIDTNTYFIVSIGVLFFTAGLIRLIIGPKDQNFSDGNRFILKAREFKEMTGLNEGLAIKTTQGITVLVTIILVTFVFWFLNKTRTGKSMRAYSDNEDLALLSGINPKKVVLITWVFTGVLATVAGTLYGLDKIYKPFTFMYLVLPVFASAILGGVGNPIGAIVGGYIIAFSELIFTFAYKKVFSYLLPESIAPQTLVQLLSTDYKIAVSFLILVLVLLIKPTGIFSGKEA